MKNKIIVFLGVFAAIVLYIVSLLLISDYQKNYHVRLYPTQNTYSVSLESANSISEYEITLENATNKCVSTQLGNHLVYDITSSTGDYVAGEELPKSNIANIYPDEIADVNLQVIIPNKAGTYEISVDIENSNGTRMSESGLVPAVFTIEVY